MTCRECARGKRYADGAVNCLLYGMIIREDHECNREGRKARGEDEGDGDGIGPGAGIPCDGGGAAAQVPGVLRG